MTNTEQYVVVAHQLKTSSEQSADLWKQGARIVAEQTDRMSRLPAVDPSAGVLRYFEMLQRVVDVNRDLATSWAHSLRALTAGMTTSVIDNVARQVDTVADAVIDQVDTVEAAAEHQVELALEAEKSEARRVRAAERAAERAVHEKAREPYLELTKADLSEKLAERDLPKTGNLDELVERLVASDSVRAPYVGLTKTELAEQLAARDLPKAGTVEELIGRLVGADQLESE